MKKLLLLFTLFFTTSSYASDDGLSFYPRASFVFNDPIMGDYSYLGVLAGAPFRSATDGISVRAGIGEEAYKANLSYGGIVAGAVPVGFDAGLSYFQTKEEPHRLLSNKKEGLALEFTFQIMLLNAVATITEEDAYIRFGFGF